MTEVPTFDRMMNPLIEALKKLGGSATIEEMENEVAEIMQLSDDQLELLHNPERSSQTVKESCASATCSAFTSFFSANAIKARSDRMLFVIFEAQWWEGQTKDF